MPLFYISGASGTGKSEVLRSLGERGYAVHGVDEDGYGRWIDRKTSAAVPFPDNAGPEDIHHWYATHDWRLDEHKIAALCVESMRDPLPSFLGGVADGERECWPFFAGVILLTAPVRVILRRIEERTDNSFGKTDNERADILSWLSGAERRYRDNGASIVRSGRDLAGVVDTVLAHARRALPRPLSPSPRRPTHMEETDVLEVLGTCRARGIDVTVDGGWGVDALLGFRSRDHGDLDLAVPHFQAGKLRSTLRTMGYRDSYRNDTWNCNFVMERKSGACVDIHTYVIDSGGNTVAGVDYQAEDLTGTGTIAGMPVRCIAPSAMVRYHTGYMVDADDFHDVQALCDRFGLDIPPDYAVFSDPTRDPSRISPPG